MSAGFTHESPVSKETVWLTPPDLVRALGPFDLDPCAAVDQPWRTARVHYTVHDNGLFLPWFGLVWCNPPFGRGVTAWLDRLSRHGDGIALLPARTDTKWFRSGVWSAADNVLFLYGRLRFHHADGRLGPGSIGTPTCLAAYGREAVGRIRRLADRGPIVAWAAP